MATESQNYKGLVTGGFFAGTSGNTSNEPFRNIVKAPVDKQLETVSKMNNFRENPDVKNALEVLIACSKKLTTIVSGEKLQVKEQNVSEKVEAKEAETPSLKF